MLKVYDGGIYFTLSNMPEGATISIETECDDDTFTFDTAEYDETYSFWVIPSNDEGNGNTALVKVIVKADDEKVAEGYCLRFSYPGA